MRGMTFFKVHKKKLYIFPLFMLLNLVFTSFLSILYILSYEIKIKIFIGIYIIKFHVINKKFSEIFCKKYDIYLKYLIKQNLLKIFDVITKKSFYHIISSL